MAGKNLDYWYDEQIKRYLIQLVRVFSNFQVKENTENGVHYNRVPARYGDMSRMVAQILRNNSENAINNAPQITIGIQSIQPARDRTAEPYHVDTTQVAERDWNKEDKRYTSDQGNLYTTQRYMPVPYNLNIQVDIWTTNTDTKLQILEQVFVLFNPSIQLQSNDNPLDWTRVFEVEMTDIQWSSRGIPAGVDEQLDIATLTFAVPIWISPPAKVQRQKIIQRIVNDIYKTTDISNLGYSEDYHDFFSQVPDDAVVVVAPGDYQIQISSGSATLINSAGVGQKWADIIEMQGELSNTSRIELNLEDNIQDRTKLVIGSISKNPIAEDTLIFNLDADTLPTDTIANVDKIIDPRASRPGDVLLGSALGQRYLLSEDVSIDYVEWGIEAKANDIVEYDGAKWIVAFDSSAVDSEAFVTNAYTNAQFKWTGTQWISSWQGTYNPGYWRLIL